MTDKVSRQGERCPPRALFDPIGERSWTLPMVCAWIMWRDMHRVQNFWEKFQAQRIVSRPVMTTTSSRDEDGNLVKNITVVGVEPSQAPEPSLKRLSLYESSIQVPLSLALEQIVEAVWQQRVVITAFAKGDGKRTTIAPGDFESLAFSHLRDEDPVDGCLRYTEGERRGELAYRSLRFDPTQIVAKWKIPGASDEEGSRSKSGAPGRPTSMHIVEHEFRRRMECGLAKTTNKAESEHLEKWFRETHPLEPRVLAKTIANNLGGLRRAIEAAQN